jgi:two-component system response regulator NreC
MPARPGRELRGDTRPEGGAAPGEHPSAAALDAAHPAGGPAMIRVVLVDDESVMRHGLCLFLDQQPDIEVVGQAGTLAEVAALDLAPHVVVTDLEVPDGRGKEVVAAIRNCFADASVLVLARTRQPAKVRDAFAAGASGYLLKTAQPADLLVGVRAVAHGDRDLLPSVAVELARWPGAGGAASSSGAPGEQPGPERLSPKEEEVVRLVALGHTNAEIAKKLGVSLRTVETHRARVLQKLGHPSRAELVLYAQRIGLIDLGP